MREKQRKIRGNCGITLIALVVTIVVLLILAGVSIATLTGEHGILTRATGAKETQRGSEVDEVVLLTVNENQIASYSDNVKKNKTQVVNDLYSKGKLTEEEKNKLLGENGETEVDKITIGNIEVDFSKLKNNTTADCDTLDGDTLVAWGKEQGMLVIDEDGRASGFVKVSDVIFTAEQIENIEIKYLDYDEESIVTADVRAYEIDENSIAIGDGRNGTALGYCFQESMSTEGPNGEAWSFTPGLYIGYGDCVISFDSITIPGYAGFPHSDKCGH